MARSKQQSTRGSLIELVMIVAVALGLALGIQAFLVKPFRIPSESMVPTLEIGQRVLVDRVSYRFGDPVTVDDPWGYGNSLEWATTCPPPRHNFTELPRIRSERPAFELHYPHMIERNHAEAHVTLTGRTKSMEDSTTPPEVKASDATKGETG